MHFIPYLNFHTHQLFSNDFLEILHVEYLDTSIGSFFSCGIHPWNVNDTGIQWDLFEQKCVHPSCLAIGECGLDFLKNPEFKIEQIEVFKRQIFLSEKLKKPMILHVVNSFDKILQIKKQSQAKQAWVVHGFNKKSNLANQLIDAGFYLSFGAHALNNSALAATIKTIPLSRIFLETDNVNIPIESVYEHVAQILALPVRDLAIQIEHNLKKISIWNG